MKKSIWLLLSLGFSVSWTLNAAELSAEQGVEFLAINGKNVDKYGEKAAKTLELDEGSYQLVVRYESSVKQGSRNTLFTSKPYVLDITMTAADAFISVPKMRIESQAQAYFRKPIWIFTRNEKEHAFTGAELEGLGFAGFRNIEEAIAAFNQKQSQNQLQAQNQVKSLDKTQIIAPLNTQVTRVNPLVLKAKHTTRLEQLKNEYLKASKEEKKAFKRWMIEADG